VESITTIGEHVTPPLAPVGFDEVAKADAEIGRPGSRTARYSAIDESKICSGANIFITENVPIQAVHSLNSAEQRQPVDAQNQKGVETTASTRCLATIMSLPCYTILHGTAIS
jgi:hypothetical protein